MMPADGERLADLLRVLDLLYPEPDPFDSLEEYARAHNEDLAALPTEALVAERFLARLRWSVLVFHRVTHALSDWLRARNETIDAELARRRRPVPPSPRGALPRHAGR